MNTESKFITSLNAQPVKSVVSVLDVHGGLELFTYDLSLPLVQQREVGQVKVKMMRCSRDSHNIVIPLNEPLFVLC